MATTNIFGMMGGDISSDFQRHPLKIMMGIVDIFRSDQATVVWLPFSTTMYDAALQKNLHFICHFCRGNEIFSSNCCCILALPQGLLKEVPIYFKFFAVKVVGQTI